MEFVNYAEVILWRIPSDAWELFDLKGNLLAVGLWVTSYFIAKWKSKTRHMQKMRLEAWNVLIATLVSAGLAFFLLMFVYSPYRQYEENRAAGLAKHDEEGAMKHLGDKIEVIENDLKEARQTIVELQEANESLADKARFFQDLIRTIETSKAVANIRIREPRLLLQKSHSRIAIPLMNIGGTPAKLLSRDITVKLGEKKDQATIKQLATMLPGHPKTFEYLVSEEKLISVLDGDLPLSIEVQLTWSDIVGRKHQECFRGSYIPDRKHFMGGTSVDEPCS